MRYPSLADKIKDSVGKLYSIHLATMGTIGHFYHIQMALTKSNQRMAYLSNNFHHDTLH